MCFSASASFAVSAGTGLVGALTITKVSRWREVPLAAVPLIFSAQQAIEGILWLRLANGSQPAQLIVLANLFAVCALVVWPVWSPLAASLVEPDRIRRLAIVLLLAAALPVALLGLSGIAAHPYGVCIVGHSLSYINGTAYSSFELGAYVVCVCAPLFLSSHTILRNFGAIVAAGLAVSAFLFLETSFSVWCFFAAAGSITVYLYFADVAQRGAKPSAA